MPKVRYFFNISSHLINKKPFRRTKNGMPNNLFKKIGIENDDNANNNNLNRISTTNMNTIKINLINHNYGYDGNDEQNAIEEDEK